MALAKKCDRCEKLYEHYPIGDIPGNWNGIKRVRVSPDGCILSETRHIDLCPECMDAFMHYLRMENGN